VHAVPSVANDLPVLKPKSRQKGIGPESLCAEHEANFNLEQFELQTDVSRRFRSLGGLSVIDSMTVSAPTPE
jgi:hypothetical protein